MGSSILIIEDREYIRTQYASHLISSGFDVDTASDKIEAIEKIRRRTYDVALVDIMLSDDYNDWAGIEILQKLQEYNEGTRCVVATEHDDMDVAIQAYQAGVVEFLRKSRISSSGELVKILERAATGVQHPLFGRFASLSALLAAPDMVPSWEATVIMALGCDGYSLSDTFQRAFAPILPILRSRRMQSGISVNLAMRRLSGQFWSKKIGHPVQIQIAPYGASLDDPQDLKEAEIVYARDKGPLRVRIARLIGCNRDDYYETLWE